MNNKKFIAAATLLLAALFISSCNPLSLLSSGAPDDVIDYYSREVEYSIYVDPDETYLVPVTTFVYNGKGILSAVFKNTWTPFTAGSDFWVLTRTDIYEVTAGTQSLSQYYVYDYIEHQYTDYDADDQPYTVTEHLLSRGETYDSDNVLRNYYDVTYDLDAENLYSTIRDYEYDFDLPGFVETARQTSEYDIVYSYTVDGNPVDIYDYTVEKKFDIKPDETEMSLAEEFASWYDADGLWTHELYHSVRSSDSGFEDVYFYTKYEWNQDYLVYMQQDFAYDDTTAAIPLLSGQADSFLDGTYDDTQIPSAYQIDFNSIGSLVESLELDYDDVGNIVRETKSAVGSVHEEVISRYNGDSELLDTTRYVYGQSYPYDKEVIRYRDETIQGVYNRIREKTVYRYNPEIPDSEQSVSSSDMLVIGTAGNSTESRRVRQVPIPAAGTAAMRVIPNHIRHQTPGADK